MLIEETARYFRKVLHQPNVWLFNFSIPIEHLFFALIFYSHFKLQANRYLAKWFLVLFPFFVLVNITLIQGIGQFNTNSVTIGSFFMILFSSLTLYELYFYDETGRIWKEPMFWIGLGVLLFNAGEFTYNIFSNFLINKEFDRAAKFFATINNKLIYVLYSSLIIGFICSKIAQKSVKD